MTLNYGYTPNLTCLKDDSDKPKIVKTYLYNFSYESLQGKVGWNIPKTLNSGYPATSIYLPEVNDTTKITLLNHTFDNDSVINNLSIMYAVYTYMKNGVKQQKVIVTFPITKNKIINFGGYQSVPLNISGYLKNYVTNVNDVVMFYIQIAKITGGNHGNESNLNVAVETVIDL